jgi:PAS domain S-box-containing protein
MATTENLLDLARRLQGIIDTAIDGIITINDKGIIESMNRAALVQFGYAIDELKGKNIHVLMPEPYHSEHDTYINNYINTRVPRIIGIGREDKLSLLDLQLVR